jgi:hypothetical protein
LRQIVTAINSRQTKALKLRGHMVEWHARTVAWFIAASVPLPKGTDNPLLGALENVELFSDGIAPARASSQMPRKALRDLTEAEIEAIVEGKHAPEPAKGSTERLMGGFGGPPRR